MKHLEKYWKDELRQMRENLMNNEGIEFTNHASKRLDERRLSTMDIANVILTGDIYVGYDVGEYITHDNKPSHRPVRVLIGETQSGQTLSIILSILSSSEFRVVTIYRGVKSKYRNLVTGSC